MCGIVAAVSSRNIVPILLDSLYRLEYRGYDSAGIAIINQNKIVENTRCSGKVELLERKILANNIQGNIGIAHTRWATHGAANEKNAHPHICNDRVVIVHNGIIENYIELRTNITEEINLHSETDTEIIATLIYIELQLGSELIEAVRTVMQKLEGAYAIAILDSAHPNTIIAAKRGSPLAIGLGINEYFVTSDPLALQHVTQKFVYLEEQDIVELTKKQFFIYDVNGCKINRTIHMRNFTSEITDKGHYQHFMQKEIFAQPNAIQSTLSGRINNGNILERSFGYKAYNIFNKTKSITLVACGTSYYAGMVAKFWLEGIAGIPCNIEVASEFRYRKTIVTQGTLFVTISQSGETADTIAALKDIQNNTSKNKYVGSLAICNVAESTLVRSSDLVILTNAGPEISVASTKAFTTQLVALFMLSLILGSKFSISKDETRRLVAILQQSPKIVKDFLKLDKAVQTISNIFLSKKTALFISRGILFPIALEGALKLKEISYINATAYPAGELKHGPLALVDENMPVVVLAPNNQLLPKIKSNIQEVNARNGKLIVVTNKSANINFSKNITLLEVPEVADILTPIAYAIPLQLLAYHVAVLKGTNVDQPRNLAKSVTVE